MYEKWIYQIYNVTFTGLHNIWYALMDFEFEKGVLMTTPLYYSIGMQNMVFNMTEFWVWVFYACAQALMILLVCFWTSQDSALENGKSFTFWAGGHHVYMNCVLLANIIILKMQHCYTGYNMMICLAQIASFFGLMYYFSIELQTDVIYRFMEEFVASRTAWLACFFIIASLWTIDHMLHSMRLFFASVCGKSYEKLDLEEEEAKLGRRRHTVLLSRQYSLKLSL